MKNSRFISGLFALLVAVSFFSCDNFEGNQEIPAYIKVDAIKLVENTDIPQSAIDGFNTSLITDAWVYIDNEYVGTYTLPCSFPILKEGNHKIDIRPGIKLNGIAMTRTEYPFYTYYSQQHNLVAGKEINIGTINVKYRSDWSTFGVAELFENPYMAFKTDGVSQDSTKLMKHDNMDTVEWGSHCGAMYLGKDQATYKIITDSIYCNNYDALILEIDYWGNIPFDIGMAAKTSSASQTYYVNAMRVNANKDKGWQKIYVVLGKVWQQLSYPNYFKFYFSPANPNKIDNGWIYIDNVKLVHKPIK